MVAALYGGETGAAPMAAWAWAIAPLCAILMPYTSTLFTGLPEVDEESASPVVPVPKHALRLL